MKLIHVKWALWHPLFSFNVSSCLILILLHTIFWYKHYLFVCQNKSNGPFAAAVAVDFFSWTAHLFLQFSVVHAIDRQKNGRVWQFIHFLWWALIFHLTWNHNSSFFGATKKCQAKTCYAYHQIGIKKTIIPCQLTLNIIAIFLFSASLKCIVVFSSISLFYIIYSFSVWLLFFCCCLFSFALSHVLCEKTEIEQTVTITTVNFLSIDAVHK